MDNQLLTDVLLRLVNKKMQAREYGVSIVNLPDFNYADFITKLEHNGRIEFFLLGFSNEVKESLISELKKFQHIRFSFAVEDAELSRNSGDESVFRILIIKRVEIEKLSSLRWFPEITLEKVYSESCDYTRRELRQSNAVIDSLITALKRKPIRSILNFERVLEYLQGLLLVSPNELPVALKKSYYKLGLCNDSTLVSGSPGVDDFIRKIKSNHKIVERIGNLEQTERQSITNYYSDAEVDKDIPRLILQYYKTKDVDLLNKMDVAEVEKCLKAVRDKSSPRVRTRKQHAHPTALAAQLVFDGSTEQIDSILDQAKGEIDERGNARKRERVEINHEGMKIQIKTEPSTERIAEQLTSENEFGGVVIADVLSPADAIEKLDKYEYIPFKAEYLDIVWGSLQKISPLVTDGESISSALSAFISARRRIESFKRRLQDVPMLQVLAKKDVFAAYLSSYERLLTAINDDFPKIWRLAPSNAKEIINILMSLDYVFILGNEACHAVPTPLHPLYLWKYIKLAEEILSSRDLVSFEDCHLSDDDKSFIVRKAEDIPDPLSIMLLPVTIRQRGAVFLPLSGRIGTLPIYSTNQQINQSESGVDYLKQAVIRYLCLYPHSGMMLKLAVIDPPSVEIVVSMLKSLSTDREFNVAGMEISIFRTKMASADWIEIEDESLNSGMLGKVKGKRSLNFQLKIQDKPVPYERILEQLENEQHLLILFDPNEVKIDTAQNNRRIHIHPLCIPKIYQYNPVDEKVEIRPANEGSVFSTYASILEKLNERPSTFSHTSTFFNTPLKRETYDQLLIKSDWLIILDQSLKSWDISLKAASEKLYYREHEYRSMGIYSKNSRKFVLGYDYIIKQSGNFIPRTEGVADIISTVRDLNDEGLLSIVSHTSAKVFDDRHGKGSLGLAVSAIHYKKLNPDSMLVGLDTQLAREWLSERDDKRLPDLVGIRFTSEDEAIIDIIEVKTFSGAFTIQDGTISGTAIEQVSVLEGLLLEMFGASEKITTISRREILREQVFECLFQSSLSPIEKHKLSELLNALFAGELKIKVNKAISFVDFENEESHEAIFDGKDIFAGNQYTVITIGSEEIQGIIARDDYSLANSNAASGDLADSQNNNAQAEELPVDENEIEPYLEKSEAESKKRRSLKDKTEQSGTNEHASTKMIVEVADTELRQNIKEKCARINKVFRDYGIQALPVNPELVQEATRFTRFSVELKSGESIKSLEKYKVDIGIQLEANGEILIDHIRGTRFISVDVPFAGKIESVSLLDNLSQLDKAPGQLNILVGQKPDGVFETLDLATAPHLLVAGTTGSGKTIFLYSIIISLLNQHNAEDIQLLIIDPKQTDFTFFEGLPLLYGNHVVTDSEEALEMIRKINEVDKEERTALLRERKSRDIESHNAKNPSAKMKRLIIVIDEYADLIQTAEIQGIRKDFENLLVMLAQRVRNLGIHLVIATQRPSAQIVTGSLKANIPFRVSFRLPSHVDSQTILDMSGAENLLGKGDMIVVTDTETTRAQGLFISEDELTEYLAGR